MSTSTTLLQTIDAIRSASSAAAAVGHAVDGAKAVKEGMKQGSLISASKAARVEPLAIIAKDCVGLDYLPDVLQTVVNLFTGFYLQAVAMHGTTVNGAAVGEVLDKFNPERDFNLSKLGMETIADFRYQNEASYQFRLPMSCNAALEAEENEEASKKPNKASTDTNAVKALTEQTNLAVGKFINIDLTVNGQSFKVPVSVRLIPVYMPQESITSLMCHAGEDRSLVERFHAWRAGRIEFVNDLILCRDLIKEEKKALMEDGQGVYAEILRRANGNRMKGIQNGSGSMATASNIFVISEAGEKALSLKLNGKFSNARVRQQAFDSTYGMIIAVINREWERVTFYYDGIAMPTEVSIKDIKTSNKKSGPDIVDVLKAMSIGQAPGL